VDFWRPDNLRRITQGRWLARAAEQQPQADLSGLSIDGRTLRPGQAFLALRGERFDGHDFLEQAAEAGAELLIVDREPEHDRLRRIDRDVLLVADTQAALALLAERYREQLSGKLIAVTGSVGKTTTCRLIDAVLSPRFTGTVSERSFNNQIGVPLTLLGASPTDAYVVVEMGTSAPGEIAALARLVQPDIAVITRVGLAHLEGLGDRDAILREKTSLLSYVREGGLGIVQGDLPNLDACRKLCPNLITFGCDDACDLRLSRCEMQADQTRFTLNDRWSFVVPLPGEHNAVNALAAVAVGRHMQMSEVQIAEGLGAAQGPRMRLEVQTVGPRARPVTIINDAYNANPESMEAALRVLEQWPSEGRRIALLGDMLELGGDAPDLHRRLGEAVAERALDGACFIGRLGLFAAETLARHWDSSRFHALANWDEGQVLDMVRSHVAAGDTVLIKASRASGLERLVPLIEQATASSSADRPPAADSPTA